MIRLRHSHGLFHFWYSPKEELSYNLNILKQSEYQRLIGHDFLPQQDNLQLDKLSMENLVLKID